MSSKWIVLIIGLMSVNFGCAPAGRPVGSPQSQGTPARPFHLSTLQESDLANPKSKGLVRSWIEQGREIWDFLAKSKLHANLKVSILSKDGSLDAEAVHGTESKRSTGQCSLVKKENVEFMVVRVLDHRKDLASSTQDSKQSYRQIVMEIPLSTEDGLRPSIISYRQVGFAEGSLVRPHNRSDINQANLQLKSSEDGSTQVLAILKMAAYDSNAEIQIEGSFECQVNGLHLPATEDRP